MFIKRSHAAYRKTRQSSALVITLATLVLVCTLILVFFSQSTLNRQLSFSSSGQYRADLVAHTGLDTITGDLKTEITAGSTVSTSNSYNIYLPISDSNMAPSRVGDQGFANLIKQSTAGSSFWSGSSYNSDVFSPVRSAANNSTLNPDPNGHKISINLWNKAGLLGDPGSGTVPTLPASYTKAPDWVLVSRQGAISNAMTMPVAGPGAGTLSDKSLGNANYVVGRYAYTIYDEGGLLDVNVAGYPSTLSGTDFVTKKGLLPQVDLSAIPGIENADAFVQWRNHASAASVTAYTNYVFNSTNGFVQVAPGDQTLVSRQDLIRYVQANAGQISTSALPYLGTFTRELNSPSYTPSPSRPKIQSAYSTFGLPVGLEDQFNPSMVNVRVESSFTRVSDNTLAQPGEPLIKYRFPLSRLQWLGHTGPNGVNATQVYNSFGLTWSTSLNNGAGGTMSGWVYNHGDPDRILRLADIAAGADPGSPNGREPDFFELLQAGINVGSLGKSAGTTISSDTTGIDSDDYYQILSIGANLIDQSDTDSFPTIISFDPPSDIPSFVICGKENLPYLNRIFYTPYRRIQTANGYNRPYLGEWIQLEIWNPSAQAQTPDLSGPTQFRIFASGTAYMATEHLESGSAPDINNTFYLLGADQLLDANSSINFTLSSANNFSQPTLLTPSNASTPDNEDNLPSETPPMLGIYEGQVFAPDSRNQTPTTPNYTSNPEVVPYQWGYSRSDTTVSPYMTFYAQYLDPSTGSWTTYQVMPYEIFISPTNDAWNGFTTGAQVVNDAMSDPRTNRFGRGIGWYTTPLNSTIRPDATSGYTYWATTLSSYPGWNYLFDGQNWPFMGAISENRQPTSGTATYYSDPDGVVRMADGAYAGSGSLTGLPLATSNFASRPYNLNRPFRSVADMGYAYRDVPWKQLDFFTANSGDSALLDLFCIKEPSPLGMEAGCLDLNTRQWQVLSAVIRGGIQAEDTGSTVSNADADSIAQALVASSSASPNGLLGNRSELVTKCASLFNYPSGGAPASIIKRQYEAAIRPLSSIGNTRTWNLLIDIIAQSGRYPITATALNQFIVEGERRYWLHVAIDRFTGKVIDQYLEPVHE